MKTILIIFAVLFLAYFLFGCAEMKYYTPQQKYNMYEKRWETVSPREELKYNPYENEWRYSE